MSMKSAQYLGYTLAEVLVVLMVIIVLGTLGAYSFGGLRDTVLVRQNIEEIKQDIQLAQQKAMLLERKQGEGWIYGIGIDFRDISNGSYKFFKWCSPFSEYGNIRTRSEIIAYNPDTSMNIGDLDFDSGGYDHGENAILPISPEDYESNGFCDSLERRKYMTNLSGMENGKINTGFDITLSSNISFVVFEAVTGRAFLYTDEGWPANYDANGVLVTDSETNLLANLGIIIFRNRGNMADTISIAPLSGNVKHVVWDDPAALGAFRSALIDIPSSGDDTTPPVGDVGSTQYCCATGPTRPGENCVTVLCDILY
jgi:type II secretory pathway pseudopilin PulG